MKKIQWTTIYFSGKKLLKKHQYGETDRIGLQL